MKFAHTVRGWIFSFTTLAYLFVEHSIAHADALAPALAPLKLMPIRSVTITTQGLATSTSIDEPKGCAHFRLSKSEAIAYLKNSDAISERDFFQTIDWSVCTVTGTVMFSNGSTAQWMIQKYRGGTLVFSDGKKQFLYCADCKGRHFQR